MEIYQSDYNARVNASEWRKRNIPYMKSSNSNKFSIASNDPLRNSKFNANINFNSVTAGLAPTVARYTPAGYIAFTGVDALSNYALKKADDKMKELNLGKYAPPPESSTPQNYKPQIPVPKSADNPEPITFNAPEGVTLIDVLQGSMFANFSIARQLENSNNIALYSSSILRDSIQSLVSVISLQGEIDVSYRDLELNTNMNIAESLTNLISEIKGISSDMSSAVEINTAYNEQNLTNFELLLDSLSPLKEGMEIKKSVDEVNLISKQLEHINYETTPIQFQNLGDEIPMATPQQMRAIKDAVVAKKNSDENTLEVDDDDIFDMFDGLPDISSIFSYNLKSSRLPTESELT